MKRLSELIKESKASTALDDIRKLSEVTTKKDKLEIASKYGIESSKTSEIEKGIYLYAIDKYKNSKEFTEDDFKVWWRYWNAPSSSVKLKQALEGESTEFIKFVKQHYEALAKKYFRTTSGKSYEKMVKVLEEIISENETPAQTKQNIKDIINKLKEETKDFHDSYIETNKEYFTKFFEEREPLKKFTINDYMSLFGTVGVGTLSRTDITNYSWKYHVILMSRNSKEYISKIPSVNIDGQEYKAKEIFVGTVTDARSSSEIDSKICAPNKRALKYRTQVLSLGTMAKSEFVNKKLEEVERIFDADLNLVAQKIEKHNMNLDNIKITSIQNDAKGFDVHITDGEKRIYARCIVAAMNSIYVRPHYRFIATERS